MLKVSAPGFSSVERPSFSLAMDQTARIDITMTVGQASQTVEVSAAPPLLQTDQTFLGTVLDAQANVTLPLATRNYNQLTLLSPGAVSLNPGAFTGSQASFQVGRPYINGNREQTNNYILDGMDNNQIDNNDVAFAPSVDAIQEFNLISQNAPASYGNYLGGIISVTIKSGTNSFPRRRLRVHSQRRPERQYLGQRPHQRAALYSRRQQPRRNRPEADPSLE